MLLGAWRPGHHRVTYTLISIYNHIQPDNQPLLEANGRHFVSDSNFGTLRGCIVRIPLDVFGIIIFIKCIYKAHFRGCHKCAKTAVTC